MKRMMHLLLMVIGLSSQLSAMELVDKLHLPAADSSEQEKKLDNLLACIGQQQEETKLVIEVTRKKIHKIKEPLPILQICTNLASKVVKAPENKDDGYCNEDWSAFVDLDNIRKN